MKRAFFHIFSTVFLSLTLAGCTSDSNHAKSSSLNPTSQLSPAARQRMNQRKEDALVRKHMVQVEQENKTSPYRYVISTERHSIFGQLVKQSTLAKHIHGQGITLLAPTNKAMEAMGNWQQLIRMEFRDNLDEFIRHHILPQELTYERFKTQDSHECLAGKTLSVNVRGGISINGARVRSGDIPTENGTVIALDDVVMTPSDLH